MTNFSLLRYSLKIVIRDRILVNKFVRHSSSMIGQTKIKKYFGRNNLGDIGKEKSNAITGDLCNLSDQSTEISKMPKRKLSDTTTMASKVLKTSEDADPSSSPVTTDAHDAEASFSLTGEGDVDNAMLKTASKQITPKDSVASVDQGDIEAEMKAVADSTINLVTNCGESWFKALKGEFSKPYFLQLAKFVDGERKKFTIFPPEDDVFSWTRITPIEEIKVVILGQDPYHGPNQAHGLCFSVTKGVPTPPSLKNIYKELTTDIPGFVSPSHGDLTGWANQGVLLLNSVLTVRQTSPNSHKDKGWETFTDAVVNWLNFHTRNTVFILWGAYAQKKGARINKTNHKVISGVHPSGLSASKGFFGAKHFSKCNDYLIEHRKSPIDWKKL